MACPVCFTGDDPVTRDSLTAGIGVLLVVTMVVLVCFAVFFVTLARRASRYEQLAREQEALPPTAPAHTRTSSPDGLGWDTR
jgi:hypothetical protein